MATRRARRRYVVLAALAAAALGSVAALRSAGAAPAYRPSARANVQAESPRWYRVPNEAAGDFRDVDAVSPDVAWAVSMSSIARGDPSEVLAFREGAWRVVHSQADRTLMAIDMQTATEGWAVGIDDDPGRSVLLPIRGGVVGPAAGSACVALLDVQLLAPSDGWAVGATSGGETCILRLQGGSWSRVPSPGMGLLSGVAMVDGERGWAVGSEGETLLFEGGSWRDVPSPVSPAEPGLFLGVSLWDMDSGWAVGSTVGRALRLKHGRWELVDTGQAVSLGGVDMLSVDLGFAAGRSSAGEPVILRVQDDQWHAEDLSQVPNVSAVLDVDMVSTAAGWAVGGQESLRYGVPPTPAIPASATSTPAATVTATPAATATPASWSLYVPHATRP